MLTRVKPAGHRPSPGASPSIARLPIDFLSHWDSAGIARNSNKEDYQRAGAGLLTTTFKPDWEATSRFQAKVITATRLAGWAEESGRAWFSPRSPTHIRLSTRSDRRVDGYSSR